MSLSPAVLATRTGSWAPNVNIFLRKSVFENQLLKPPLTLTLSLKGRGIK
jgi:hypothetical protein